MDSAHDTKATESSDDSVLPNAELEAIACWRLSQMLSLGIEQLEAEALAQSDADLGLLRRLVGQGCPPQLAARIAR
jgi:hypothetical protein